MIIGLPRFALLALAMLCMSVVGAPAHPHVWVTMKSELVYTPDGSLTTGTAKPEKTAAKRASKR